MKNNQNSFTYQEILSQGETWAKTIELWSNPVVPLKEFLQKPYSDSVFTGCGSTYYLSLSAAVIWRHLTGQRATAYPASELWFYPENIFQGTESLLVSISRSGYTTETLRAIDTYLANGYKNLLAITCYPEKPMAGMTDYVFAASHAGEESIAQTRSFSNMYVMAQLAAAIAGRNPEFIRDLGKVPGFFDNLVNKYEGLARQLAENQSLEHFVFLGSNLYYGLACEGMLKMKEMSLSISEAFHFFEFRHGPKSVVKPGTLIIGLINDKTCEQELKVLAEMKELGATTLAITDSAKNVHADYVIELGTGLESVTRSILTLPFMQLLAYYRSISKGLNPDRPENLTAVVEF